MRDKSTSMIHDIIANHGSDDNRMLMVELKNLRKQVILETHYEYKTRVREIKVLIESIPEAYYE